MASGFQARAGQHVLMPRERTLSLPSKPVGHASARRSPVAAALALLCACGGATESEEPESFEPASLDCNAPLSEEQIFVLLGATEAAPPAPDEAAAASLGVVQEEARSGHALLATNPQQAPYKVNVPEHCIPLGDEFVSTLRICVDAAGEVSGVTILSGSLPIIDSQLSYVIARWRYQPYVVDGLATPFCYHLNYRVR